MKKLISVFISLFCCLMLFSEESRIKYIDWQSNVIGEDIPKWVMAVINNKSESEIKKSLNISNEYKIWTFKYYGNNLEALKLEAKSNNIVESTNVKKNTKRTHNFTIHGIEQERSYWLQDKHGQYLYIVILKNKAAI